MDIQTYSKLAMRTVSPMPTAMLDIVHAAMGISGEAGEVLDSVKKTMAYGKNLDRDHVVEEIGDCLFYMNMMVKFLDTTWDEVLDRNIRKLEARYPELKFSAERANNRDTDAEAAAMRGVA